ncbi:MAG TPA: hypothetical protein VFQ92_02505 [Blastocatellia bacterium]|nr:hypothetical protein [Blastocatellia bacterium]
MPQQGPSRGNPIQDYITVAERIEKFYERYPEGRIITHIVEHDGERGFILMRAEIYRNADDTHPSATGHAYELKSEGYVQRTSYIEVCETSTVGRALAMAGFEVKRGIASREEMEKSARLAAQEAAAARERNRRAAPQPAAAEPARETEPKQGRPATEEQKDEILDLLESVRPGDRRSQHKLLVEITGKQSRDDLTEAEALELIQRLKDEPPW